LKTGGVWGGPRTHAERPREQGIKKAWEKRKKKDMKRNTALWGNKGTPEKKEVGTRQGKETLDRRIKS